MAFKVVIPQDITAEGKNFLIEKGYDVVVGDGNVDPEALKETIKDADALLVRTAPYTADILAAAPKVKVIGRHGIGVDNIDVNYCTEHGIWVTFAPQSNGLSVAEHTIGMMISMAHQIPYYDRGMRKGEWKFRNNGKSVDLQGKTLAILALGRIGRLVAHIAGAIGMKIKGYDPFLPQDKFPENVEYCNSIEECVAGADFITIHMPSTKENKGMFNKKFFDSLKDGAYFVNCARGDLVDIEALGDACESGKLAAAATDVFPEEPPKDYKIFKLDNVVVTPHSAALTQESMDRMGLHAAMGIHSVLSGEKPQWPINQPKL